MAVHLKYSGCLQSAIILFIEDVSFLTSLTYLKALKHIQYCLLYVCLSFNINILLLSINILENILLLLLISPKQVLSHCNQHGIYSLCQCHSPTSTIAILESSFECSMGGLISLSFCLLILLLPWYTEIWMEIKLCMYIQYCAKSNANIFRWNFVLCCR